MEPDRIIGLVTEFIENREITPRLDTQGNVQELVPGEVKCSLRLKVKNTVGEIRELVVDVPADMSEFFAASHTRDDMAKVLVGG